jgi:hypothetical protein
MAAMRQVCDTFWFDGFLLLLLRVEIKHDEFLKRIDVLTSFGTKFPVLS